MEEKIFLLVIDSWRVKFSGNKEILKSEEIFPLTDMHFLIGNEIEVSEVLLYNGASNFEELFSQDWDSKDLRDRVLNGGKIYHQIAIRLDQFSIINLSEWGDYKLVYPLTDKGFHFYHSIQEGVREIENLLEGPYRIE